MVTHGHSDYSPPSFDSERFLQALQRTVAQLLVGLPKQPKPLPCFLLIGSRQSGKTNLITESKLPILQTISLWEQTCHCWLSSEAIYCELPSSLWSAADPVIWYKTLKILQQSRHYFRLAGILCVLNLAQGLQDGASMTTPWLQEAIQPLYALHQAIKQPVPLFILYTHLDRLQGFQAFYADISPQEQEQAYGFFLNSTHARSNQTLMETFQAWVRSISQNTVRHIHKQRDGYQKILVYEFPLQLESLGALILPSSSVLDTLPRLPLYGVFFSSNQCEGLTYDRFSSAIYQHFNLKNTPHLLEPVKHAYFSHQLLAEKILKQVEIFQPEALKQPWHIGVLNAGILILGLFLGLGLSQHRSLAKADLTHLVDASKEAQAWLLTSTSNQSTLPTEIMKLLSELHPTSAWFNRKNLSYAMTWPLLFSKTAEVRQIANQAYERLLHEWIGPRLKEILTTLLIQNQAPLDEQYNALKIYLMLGHKAYQHKSVMKTWFTDFLTRQSGLNASQGEELAVNLNSLLKQNDFVLKTDQALIDRVQARFAAQPPAILGFQILKAEHKETIDSPIDKTALFGGTHALRIPVLYTRSAFSRIVEHAIPEISQRLRVNDWVIGKPVTDEPISTLQQTIQAMYISDYINFWHLFMYKPQPLHFETIKQVVSTLSELSQSNQSPLTQWFSWVQKNTEAFKDHQPLHLLFNKQITEQFGTFKFLSTQQWTELQKKLAKLHSQFKALQDSENPNAKAWVWVKALAQDNHLQADEPLYYLAQTADTLPTPLKKWIIQLHAACLKILLSYAQQYLEKIWQTQVFSFYEAHIANHYPIDKLATESIKLTDFTHFFGQEGLIHTFFTTYLKDFVDTSSTTWQLKKIQGYQFNIHPDLLQQFTRTLIIQKMFFKEKDKRSQLHVEFTLQPISFEPIIKDIEININQQRLLSYQGSYKVNTFNWPGDSKNAGIELIINTIDHHQHLVKEVGDWAFFRLLDKANVQSGEDTKHYRLVFALQGAAAQFELVASDIINPFIPNILNQFSLKRSLE